MTEPQSSERIRGRDNLRAYQQAYPNPPSILPRRLMGARDVWVVEARADYGDGQTYHVTEIVEYRDGKIWWETRTYAQPFQAPQWRAQWVEPIEGSPAPGRPPTQAGAPPAASARPRFTPSFWHRRIGTARKDSR